MSRATKPNPTPDLAGDAPRNPHCAPQWPAQEYQSWELARVRRAVTGAHTLALLVMADDVIRADMEESDTPATEPQPLTPVCRHGVVQALAECLASASFQLERLTGAKVVKD